MNLLKLNRKLPVGSSSPIRRKRNPRKARSWPSAPAKKDEPMTLKVGDTVLYGKYSGTEITLDTTHYLIMKESDVYAIIK